MTLGSLGALPFIPPICDKWGRKAGIIIGSVFVLLGVGLQAGARNFDMFIAGRFVIGFGMGMCCLASHSTPSCTQPCSVVPTHAGPYVLTIL